MSVLLLDILEPDALAWLQARHSVEFRPGLADDGPGLHKALSKTEALIAPPRVMINRDLLNHAPKLRVVGRIHDGTENIDQEACRKQRVRIVQAADATVRAQAEYLLAALLLLFRRGIGLADTMPVPGRELSNSTVGLLGLAPMAHVLASLLAPMGVRVVGYDPSIHHTARIWQRVGVQPLALNELMETADAVSVQLAYASRYRGFINSSVLAHSKPGQLWAGICRVSMFDLPALAQALQTGRIRACMLDNKDARLTAADSVMAGVPNLWLTPEISGNTVEARLRGSWYLADRIHETLSLFKPRILISGHSATPGSRPVISLIDATTAGHPATGDAPDGGLLVEDDSVDDNDSLPPLIATPEHQAPHAIAATPTEKPAETAAAADAGATRTTEGATSSASCSASPAKSA